MQLINQSKGVVLAENLAFADNPFSRMRGLLGRNNIPPGEALVLTKINSIHSFFMRFAIDVLFVDSEKKIIGLIHSFKPWRLSRIFWGASSVIELPAGTLLNTLTTLGDIIAIK